MSATDTAERTRLNNAPRHFFTHLATMPTWHKIVLFLGLALAIAGGAGWMVSHASTTTTTTTQTQAPSAKVPGSSGFVDSSNAPSDSTTTVVTHEEPPSLIARLSPNATRIGGSVVAGFIFGWIFRAFLKTVTFFALLAAGALFALSYFGVINVDLSSAREQYSSALHWLTDQGSRLKDVLLTHLPSSSGGAVGAFLGFRRR